MYYDFAITVPGPTPQSAPVVETLKLTQGIINRVSIQFPRGTYALVHIQVYHHAHQVWPTNPGGSFNADGYPIEFDEAFELETEPYELEVKAWSLADTYSYDINTRFLVLRQEDIEKQSSLMTALKKFTRLIGIGA